MRDLLDGSVREDVGDLITHRVLLLESVVETLPEGRKDKLGRLPLESWGARGVSSSLCLLPGEQFIVSQVTGEPGLDATNHFNLSADLVTLDPADPCAKVGEFIVIMALQ